MKKDKTGIGQDRDNKFNFMPPGQHINAGHNKQNQRKGPTAKLGLTLNMLIKLIDIKTSHSTVLILINAGRLLISDLLKKQPVEKKSSQHKDRKWNWRTFDTRPNSCKNPEEKPVNGIEWFFKPQFKVPYFGQILSHIPTYNCTTNTRENKALRNYCKIIKEAL